ncbi:FtsX-like permease family protein [Thalassotalea psychrophila]|uniref:FtsX-like permease family protein n=1 Tax=Thalassotalea psychrophila TaxID=3065647 RepID=A0ABY9TXE0_9GAMM|nr:FtsX-like permease family protein [Colwelliaceae bacterium SQ149]
MFQNYIKIALRALAKNKLYAAINIIGLAIGITVYLFGGIIAEYERNHDTMYKNHERIYTVGSIMSPTANIGVSQLDNTYSAMGPLIGAELEELEAFARTIRRGYLLTIGDDHFHETVKFADKELLTIFDFNYLSGDSSALADPKGLVLTRDTAMKFFGRTDVVGETVMLNHEFDLHVTAVIEEVPQNSHFNSSLISGSVTMFAPLEALNRIDDWDLAGNWNNISGGNQVYVMTKEVMPLTDLNRKLNAIFDRHVEPEMKEKFMTSLNARQLKDTNAAFWDMVGMPVIESIQILGVLVLIIAIVNYTNLATAQSIGRAKEVGLRKTLGAGRGQLMTQFLTESMTIAFISMILAIVFLELLVPLFNNATDKVVVIEYVALLPWLLATTVIVGLIAGAYPSYLITKTTPIDALRDVNGKGAKGNLFRSIMIGTQFMLSIFMLALVMIVFFQNEKVQQSSDIYPKDEVLVLEKTSVESIRKRENTLRNELLQLDDVSSVTFAAQVPFEQSNSQREVSRVKGDENSDVQANINEVDHDFLKTFDVPLVAGRDFSRDVLGDERRDVENRRANVIVNVLLTKKLGFTSPEDAVGQTFWGEPGEKEAFQYDIVGVMEDQNLLGLHNKMKAWIFINNPYPHRYGAIRIRKGASANIISEIEEAWKRVLPDYPIQHKFLDGLFNQIYQIYKTMNGVLAGFAGLALLLALIGLFGLAAFMARSRTKEIGIRKVMGASLPQIVKLLLWQFSKPVMWAIIFALPLAYFASNMYLQFFAERIDMQIPIIIMSGIVAVGLAWVVIALHAFKVARQNPITALRYE